MDARVAPLGTPVVYVTTRREREFARLHAIGPWHEPCSILCMVVRVRSIAFALTNLGVAIAGLQACSSSTSTTDTDNTCKAEQGCLTQGCPQSVDVKVTAEVACEVATQGRFDEKVCEKACNASGISCAVEPSFIQELAANADAGASGDASAADAGDGGASTAACPKRAATVTCTPHCYGGRGTTGVDMISAEGDCEGAHFAQMAELEAISVLAFERMARELEALGAPRKLVEAARAAADEERSHAWLMMDLALARGVTVRFPAAPVAFRSRSLFELACENAREGCVRESYGAALAAFAKERAADPTVRTAMTKVAIEEARHAQLSWDLHAWALTRLDARDADVVLEEMEDARAELRASLREATAWGTKIGLPSEREANALLEATEALLFAA